MKNSANHIPALINWATFLAALIFFIWDLVIKFETNEARLRVILFLIILIVFTLLMERRDFLYGIYKPIKSANSQVESLSSSVHKTNNKLEALDYKIALLGKSLNEDLVFERSPKIINTHRDFLITHLAQYRQNPRKIRDFFFHSAYPTHELAMFLENFSKEIKQGMLIRLVFPSLPVLKKSFHSSRGFEGQEYSKWLGAVIVYFKSFKKKLEDYSLVEQEHVLIRYYYFSPVANVILINADEYQNEHNDGYALYIPFMYGDFGFEKIPSGNSTDRIGIEINSKESPEWFENLIIRFSDNLWSQAGIENNQYESPIYIDDIIKDLEQELKNVNSK